MSLSQTSVQQLAEKISALVVDDLADEVAELVHTSISNVMSREFNNMDEELEMDVAMEAVTNIVFSTIN